MDPIEIVHNSCVNSWKGFSGATWVWNENYEYLHSLETSSLITSSPWDDSDDFHRSSRSFWDHRTAWVSLTTRKSGKIVKHEINFAVLFSIPIALTLGVAATHHVVSDSRWTVASHQTFILGPNWNDDWSKTLRYWRPFRQSTPTSNKRQLISEILLKSIGQASRRNARTVKHWRLQFQNRNVIVESENVEVFVRNNSLDSLDFRVISRDVVAADKRLRRFRFILWMIVLKVPLTRIS